MKKTDYTMFVRLFVTALFDRALSEHQDEIIGRLSDSDKTALSETFNILLDEQLDSDEKLSEDQIVNVKSLVSKELQRVLDEQ